MAKRTNTSPRPAEKEADHFGLERLIFFSDAVFAIAITLLALDIRLPVDQELATNAQLAQALSAIWPKYMAYMISFWVIGSFWLSHHRQFRYIRRYDHRLLLINLFLLMSIAFIPFPTGILSEYGNRTATIFYAVAIILPALLLFALWSYAAHNNRLIDANTDQHVRRREALRPLATAGVFLFSIGLAFVDSDLAKYSWGLIAAIHLFIK